MLALNEMINPYEGLQINIVRATLTGQLKLKEIQSQRSPYKILHAHL